MKYVPHSGADTAQMLAAIGIQSTEELFADVPESLRLRRALNLPQGLSEMQCRAFMESLAEKNQRFSACFRGAGAYRHYIPAAVKQLVSRSEFYTAYTPYQPEISQGVLQAIYEYQTMICELTGMDASNASVYDGATAASEAIAMCLGGKRTKAVICATINPQTTGVVKTWCGTGGAQLAVAGQANGMTDLASLEALIDDSTACVVVQQPNFFGLLEDVAAIERMVHARGAKLILSCEPISLGVLKSPGEWGADIAIGEGQPLGTDLNFGGPYLGFMACRETNQRKLPGRIVGQTTDFEGNRAYVLTLQAREQHIRREKASSNICSNEALVALTAAVYLSMLGAEGLMDVALTSYDRAHDLTAAICALPGMGMKYPGAFFNEFVIESTVDPRLIEEKLVSKGMLSGLPLAFLGEEFAHSMLYCCTECNTPEQLDALIAALKEVC